MYGLKEKHIKAINSVFSKYPQIEKTILYGSRAKGNYRNGSDIDLTLVGNDLDLTTLFKIEIKLDDLLLPYKMDLSILHKIENSDLVDHIKRVGIIFYLSAETQVDEKVENEWKEVKLGSLLNLITKGTTPPKGKGFAENGINYIKSDAINYDGVIDVAKFVSIDKETHQKFIRSQLEEFDILFSMAGAYLGKNGIVLKSMLPANTNQALAILRVNQDLALPYYIGQYLRQPSMIDYINNMSGQSAQPNINFQEISSIEVNLPSLFIQKSIAEILTSLDDKIDLLHRQNKTLEAMAETLFREWFVENAEEDWEEKPLSSIAAFLNGLACQKFPPKNEIDKLPVLKIKQLRNGFSNDCDWCTTDVKPQYIVHNGDVIFSWSASLMVKIWDGETAILNQHLFKVTSDKFPKWYYYLWSKHHLEEFISISASHATTMGHIKRGDLDNAMILVPDDDKMIEFTEIQEPIIERIITNNKQLSKLVELRETLLPQLMSGEIRVVEND